MRALLTIAAALGAVSCYIDAEQRDLHAGGPGGIRTLLFVRKITPLFTHSLDRPLPTGARRRIDAEENLSPFHSVLVIKRKPEDILGTVFKRAYNSESFIKDFLASHLQHVQGAPRGVPSPKQFNTEKIYNDLYKGSHNPPALKAKEKDLFVEDDIDSIIANVAKELGPSEAAEETRHKASLGKDLTKTKKRLGKKFRNARKAISKGFKLNGLTIVLFVIVGVVSGYAGYCMKGRVGADDYMPLAK
ncbi:hypothetical protein NECID01_1628 [Nematocida sp. AWRm77]|nr:hypothetical protein NECID01_1628 [Nematocida sp. AWRm77]